MATADNEVMHFALESPELRRKELLNSVLSYLQSIKDFEVARESRHEKTKEFVKLVKAITELKDRIKEFEDMLPKVDLSMYDTEAKHEAKPEPKELPKEPELRLSKNILERNKKLSKLDSEIERLKEKVAAL